MMRTKGTLHGRRLSGGLLALAAAGLALQALPAGGGERIVEVGPVALLVSEVGVLRDIRVDGRTVVGKVFLAAACRDASISGDKRLWQHTHDVGKPGVTIAADAERGRAVITREGVLGYGQAEADRTVAYRERIEVSASGMVSCRYEVEIVRELQWGPRPVNGAIEVPIELAAGRLCTLNYAAPRLVPHAWSRAEQVVGGFSMFQIDAPGGRALEVVPGPVQAGSLNDARAWGRFPHLYLSVARATPWFEGAKPLAQGTKWDVAFTIQLPVGAAPSAGAQPGRVLLADDFERPELGKTWLPGQMPQSALDRYNQIEVAGSERTQASIRNGALDLHHVGKPGSCSIRSAESGISCLSVIEVDFTLAADDSTGSTRHSLYLRSRADPGTCLCLHVDTAKQWWFFELKEHGKWQGEKLFYYPFRYRSPGREVTYHVRIESYGDGTLQAWLSGGGIPVSAMPVAVNSVRAWTPFSDGELFLVSTHSGEGTRCHSQWDNVRVSALAPWPTLNELYYRDQLLVEFSHYRFVPEGSSVQVEVRRPDDPAALVSGEVKPLVPGRSQLRLDVANLPRASYAVVATLFDPAGQRLAEAAVDFVKVRDPQLKLADMKVHIDQDNNIVVDGKPFFPIGLYCVTLEGAKRWTVPEELFAELKAAGFNTVQNYSLGAWSLQPETFDTFVMPWLDAADKHGLKVYFDLQGPEGRVRRRRAELGDLADPLYGGYDAPPEVAWRVRKLMKHRALLCWYTADEPIAHGQTVDELARQNRLIKLLDPHHPTVIATCPGGEHCAGYRRCCQAVDILATDHYPMPKEPAHAWRRTALKGEEATQGLQPLWAIPQCFSRGAAEMTEAEIRLETYLAIVHGARGVVWWACCYAKRDYPRNWEATKRLAAELSRISPILLDRDAEQPVALEPVGASIDLRLKQHGGKRYLLAVNHSPQSTGPVSFALADMKACRSTFDGSPRAVANGAFGDTFAAYQVQLYEVE